MWQGSGSGVPLGGRGGGGGGQTKERRGRWACPCLGGRGGGDRNGGVACRDRTGPLAGGGTAITRSGGRRQTCNAAPLPRR